MSPAMSMRASIHSNQQACLQMRLSCQHKFGYAVDRRPGEKHTGSRQ